MFDFSFVPVLLEATADATESASKGWLSTASPVLLMALVILAFYFLLIRPQKKKEKEDQKMRNSIVPGDTVTTIGGIVGVVRSIKEDEDLYIIETGADKNKIAFKRWAIQSKDVKDAKNNNDSSKEALTAKESKDGKDNK